jgi:outer membrane protein assembly factor BamD
VIPRGGAALAIGLAAVLGAGGCGPKKVEVSVEDASAEATYRKGVELLSRHDLREAMEVLRRIDFTTEAREQYEPLTRLALADATFYQGTEIGFIDARSLYLDFVTMYGNHALAPYAQLQAGLCSLEQVNHPSRDQTQTHQAIEDLRLVESRWPSSAYVAAARALMRQAETNLAESELIVGRYYYDRKFDVAAVQRLRTVLDRFPAYAGMDEVLFYLGRAHLRLGNDADGRRYLSQVVQQFDGGEYAKKARALLGSGEGASALEARSAVTPP